MSISEPDKTHTSIMSTSDCYENFDDGLQKIKELEEKIKELEEKNKELDRRLGSSLSNLSKKDVGGSQSVSDSHSALGGRFRRFESDLYGISSSIYVNSKHNQPLESREKIKRSKAEIQHKLSKIILTDQLVRPDSCSCESEVEEIIKRYLERSLDKSDESYVSAAMVNFRKEFSKILHNTFLSYIKQNMMNESNLKLIQNRVESYVRQNDISLQPEVSEIVKEGITLLRDILAADPPGRLWILNDGTVFSSATSEDRSSRSAGNIEFTIFPGYSVGDHVYHRAIVFTEKSEQPQPDASPVANINLAETQNIHETFTESPQAKIERLENRIKYLLSGSHGTLKHLDSKEKKYIEANELIEELIPMIRTGKYPSDQEQEPKYLNLCEDKALCYYCLGEFEKSLSLISRVYSSRRKSNIYNQQTIDRTYDLLKKVEVKVELRRREK